MIRVYSHDYAGWAEDTAKAIAEGRFDEVDREALAEEVAGLGITERHRLESALRILLIHLLKAKYQPEKHTRSWDNTIGVQRSHIKKFLKLSPSLRSNLFEILADAYETARFDASSETGIDVEIFPVSCEWSVEQVIDHA